MDAPLVTVQLGFIMEVPLQLIIILSNFPSGKNKDAYKVMCYQWLFKLIRKFLLSLVCHLLALTGTEDIQPEHLRHRCTIVHIEGCTYDAECLFFDPAFVVVAR